MATQNTSPQDPLDGKTLEEINALQNGVLFSRLMKTFFDALPDKEAQADYTRAVLVYGFEGLFPQLEEGSPARTFFDASLPFLRNVREDRARAKILGKIGGQSPKNPASYKGNQNARKHGLDVPNVQPVEDPQAVENAEENKERLAQAWKDCTEKDRFCKQFAENLGTTFEKLTFPLQDFEEWKEDLRDPAFLSEALLVARAKTFARFGDWEEFKQTKEEDGKPVPLAFALQLIKEDLEKRKTKAQAKPNGQTAIPAPKPPQKPPASPETIKPLPKVEDAPQTGKELKDGATEAPKREKLWAGRIVQKFARAFEVAETAIQFDKKDFEEMEATFEEKNRLRRFLWQAKEDAKRPFSDKLTWGQKLRKDALKGAKLPLKSYLLGVLKFEEDLFNDKTQAGRTALLSERKPFLYKKPAKA